MKEGEKRRWWVLPSAGCLGAATGMLPAGLMLLAVLFWALTYEIYGGSRTGMGLLVFAGIPLATAGGVIGALLGFLFGWIGRSIGIKIGGRRAEGIGAIIGGFLGGVIFLAGLSIYYLTQVAS